MKLLPPETFEVANDYLLTNSIAQTADNLGISPDQAQSILARPEAKNYISQVYFDQGYRNRNKLGALLDRVIDAKIQEAEETEILTSKDLVDLIALAHKMRIDELKIANERKVEIKSSGYLDLMARLA